MCHGNVQHHKHDLHNVGLLEKASENHGEPHHIKSDTQKER